MLLVGDNMSHNVCASVCACVCVRVCVGRVVVLCSSVCWLVFNRAHDCRNAMWLGVHHTGHIRSFSYGCHVWIERETA